MSRSTIAVVTVLVLALLVSTAGLVMASQTTQDFAGQPAILAPGPVPQPADDGHHDGSHFKFEGAVTAENLSGDPPTGNIEVASGVDDVVVEITADTEIEHGPIQVDDWVEVKGQIKPGEPVLTVIAEKVEVKDHHDGEGSECRKEEFYGRLKQWEGTSPGDTWTIETPNGLVDVLIDAQTEIKGTPAADVLVEVEACRQADGTLLARELKVHDHGDHGHDDRVEFHARIIGPTCPPPGPPWPQVWELERLYAPGDPWLVQVTTATAIVGTPACAMAEIHGSKAPEGSGVDVIASKIEIEDHHPPGQGGVEIVKIEGAITDLPSDPKAVGAVWQIEGIPITVVADTLILDQRAGIALGVWADVHALVQRDATTGDVVSYDAIRIKTKYEDEPPGEVHFEGTFEGSVPSANGVPGDEDWTVSGQTFIVPSGVGPSVPPVAGDRVKIKAMHDDNGTPADPTDDTYTAFKVEVRGEDHD